MNTYQRSRILGMVSLLFALLVWQQVSGSGQVLDEPALGTSKAGRRSHLPPRVGAGQVLTCGSSNEHLRRADHRLFRDGYAIERSTRTTNCAAATGPRTDRRTFASGYSFLLSNPVNGHRLANTVRADRRLFGDGYALTPSVPANGPRMDRWLFEDGYAIRQSTAQPGE